MIVNADCDTLADCKPKLSLGLTQNKMFARDCILAYFCRMTQIDLDLSTFVRPDRSSPVKKNTQIFLVV